MPNTTNCTMSQSTERTSKVASDGIMCLAFEVGWSRIPDGIRCSDDLRNIWEGIRSLVSTLEVIHIFSNYVLIEDLSTTCDEDSNTTGDEDSNNTCDEDSNTTCDKDSNTTCEEDWFGAEEDESEGGWRSRSGHQSVPTKDAYELNETKGHTGNKL